MVDHGAETLTSKATVGSQDPGCAGAVDLRLAFAIVDVARELARATPPPRGASLFWLDSDAGYDLHALDVLCSRGIFRKYEFALQLGSGLGGKARWLAARSGCRVVGIDARPSTVAAATLLNRRARMEEQVTFQVGRGDSLPLRPRAFTHVWIVDALGKDDASLVFAEAFRVLRPGAQVAVHEEGGTRTRAEGLVRALHGTGFVDLEVREVPLADLPHTCQVAQDRLRVAAQAWTDATAERVLARLSTRQAVALQIFGRRPS